jgi:hypothetical protein
MVRRWIAGLATCAVVAPLLLLAGCSSRHEAAQSLPTTTGNATSKSRSALGPVDLPMPAKAIEHSADGFNEFTRYYVALINRLNRDLDARYLRQLSRNCATCDRLAGDALADADKGYRYTGGTIWIASVAPAHLTDAGAETAFVINQDRYAVVDSSGNTVAGLTAEPLFNVPAGAVGEWDTDHWVLTKLSFG